MTNMTLPIIVATLLAVAACGPRYAPPLCDREAQEWTKFGTEEDTCAITTAVPSPLLSGDDDRDPPSTPPSVGGNNGWGNGDQSAPGNSGDHNNAENNGRGNSHNRHGNPNPN